MEVDGCLRLKDRNNTDSRLVLWPYRSDIRVTVDCIEVINRGGKPIASVGDELRSVGAVVKDSRATAGFDVMISSMPIKGCPGPYWVVASLETMAE